MIVSPYAQPRLARQAQQQQTSTTATMAMIRVVFDFFGAASGTGVGSKLDIIPPLNGKDWVKKFYHFLPIFCHFFVKD
jgi:hypothetical protein